MAASYYFTLWYNYKTRTLVCSRVVRTSKCADKSWKWLFYLCSFCAEFAYNDYTISLEIMILAVSIETKFSRPQLSRCSEIWKMCKPVIYKERNVLQKHGAWADWNLHSPWACQKAINRVRKRCIKNGNPCCPSAEITLQNKPRKYVLIKKL